MFFLKSLVFTVFSPSFYKEAVEKGMRQALGVFFLFSLIVSFVSTITFFLTFGSTLSDIPNNLSGFPDVEIRQGTLTTNPEKQFIFSDKGTYVVMDSTGSINSIPEGYTNGILFATHSIIIRNEEYPQDQEIPYDQLLKAMEMDSVSLTKENISSFLQTMGIIVMISSPLFIFTGQFLGTLFSALVMSLIGLIILSAQGVPEAFRKSFIIALYASIPVYYIGIIVMLIQKAGTLIGISFSLGTLCCLIPLGFSLIKWGTFWGMGAWGITRKS